MKIAVIIIACLLAPRLFAQPLLTMEKIFTQLDTTRAGLQGTRKLEFTNMGNKSLTITGVITTQADEKVTYPRKPIAPGASGVIVYTYTSPGCGKFNRDITIQSTGGDQVVHLKGYVICEKEEEVLK